MNNFFSCPAHVWPREPGNWIFFENNPKMAASIGKIESGTGDAISRLYPKVDESETPLPRSWSPKDKCTFIGLSQTNLRVHYKGQAAEYGSGAPKINLCYNNCALATPFRPIFRTPATRPHPRFCHGQGCNPPPPPKEK